MDLYGQLGTFRAFSTAVPPLKLSFKILYRETHAFQSSYTLRTHVHDIAFALFSIFVYFHPILEPGYRFGMDIFRQKARAILNVVRQTALQACVANARLNFKKFEANFFLQ